MHSDLKKVEASVHPRSSVCTLIKLFSDAHLRSPISNVRRYGTGSKCVRVVRGRDASKLAPTGRIYFFVTCERLLRDR